MPEQDISETGQDPTSVSERLKLVESQLNHMQQIVTSNTQLLESIRRGLVKLSKGLGVY